MKKYFIEENVEMANKYMKKMSLSSGHQENAN